MGVKGLWSLLGPGKPIDPRDLRGKILAVDLSIWLYKVRNLWRNIFSQATRPYLCNFGHKTIRILMTFNILA